MPTITGTAGNDYIPVPFILQPYTIYGLDGDDTIDSYGGNDLIYGGNGNDTIIGSSGADVIYGGAGEDNITGDAGNDILYSGDALNGGNVNETMLGGAGNDILIGTGAMYGDSGNDTFYVLEGGGLISGDDGADIIYGNGAIIMGGAGNDRIYMDGDLAEGGDGADTFYVGTGGEDGFKYGQLGNDIYVFEGVEAANAMEAAGEGYDIVRTDYHASLDDNIEALQLTGSANVDGGGNDLANNLQGNSGNNRLSGDDGVDTINGNDGDDRINGGSGNDLLRGGSGADIFVVSNTFGALLETDQVYDFSAAEGDTLDLSGAYTGEFTLVSSFSKVAGQMTLSFAGGITTLKLDTTGDGKVDYQMKINGDVTGESGDWLL
ncbi:MAG: hemolysin-type calcium-binding repeat family protein [Caulobacter sp.]|nr:hemolysin-type calcium-binding repeat family protein [Caulobacter sp.]